MATKKTGKLAKQSSAAKSANIKAAVKAVPRSKTSIDFVRSVRGR